ncbi:hypothetical protein ACFYYM_08255 [Streptomyces erythrochromogenes]|uniref:hypothetical protein n=1 Tax=Streptomyces erythrochromogenes TaxID=285574 RepID=UPI00367B7C13
MHIGCTMMTEQAGPREFVGHVVGAERAGFDFSVISDRAELPGPAGFVQVGGDQQESFLAWSEAELLPALREL